MKNKGEVILYSIVLVILIGVFLITASSCDGTLVRGVFWYECINN